MRAEPGLGRDLTCQTPNQLAQGHLGLAAVWPGDFGKSIHLQSFWKKPILFLFHSRVMQTLPSYFFLHNWGVITSSTGKAAGGRSQSWGPAQSPAQLLWVQGRAQCQVNIAGLILGSGPGSPCGGGTGGSGQGAPRVWAELLLWQQPQPCCVCLGWGSLAVWPNGDVS